MTWVKVKRNATLTAPRDQGFRARCHPFSAAPPSRQETLGTRARGHRTVFLAIQGSRIWLIAAISAEGHACASAPAESRGPGQRHARPHLRNEKSELQPHVATESYVNGDGNFLKEPLGQAAGYRPQSKPHVPPSSLCLAHTHTHTHSHTG